MGQALASARSWAQGKAGSLDAQGLMQRMVCGELLRRRMLRERRLVALQLWARVGGALTLTGVSPSCVGQLVLSALDANIAVREICLLVPQHRQPHGFRKLLEAVMPTTLGICVRDAWDTPTLCCYDVTFQELDFSVLLVWGLEPDLSLLSGRLAVDGMLSLPHDLVEQVALRHMHSQHRPGRSMGLDWRFALLVASMARAGFKPQQGGWWPRLSPAGEADFCPVCQEAGGAMVVTMSCGHTLHPGCGARVAESPQPLCPLCRQPAILEDLQGLKG